MRRRPMKKVFYKNGVKYIREIRLQRIQSDQQQRNLGETDSNTQNMNSDAGPSQDRAMLDDFSTNECPERKTMKTNNAMQNELLRDLLEEPIRRRRTYSCSSLYSATRIVIQTHSLDSLTRKQDADAEQD